jgi:hypothetical protein
MRRSSLFVCFVSAMVSVVCVGQRHAIGQFVTFDAKGGSTVAPRVSLDVLPMAIVEPAVGTTTLQSAYRGQPSRDSILVSLPISFSAFSTQSNSASFDHLQVRIDLGNPQLQIVDLKPTPSSTLSLAPTDVHFSFARTQGGTSVVARLSSRKTASLEGNHTLLLTLLAPADWRGHRFHVQLTASQSMRSLSGPLPGFNSNPNPIAQDAFPLIAVHEYDSTMQQRTSEFIGAHQKLRQSAATHARAISRAAAPTVIHQVSHRLELTQPRIPTDWLQRTIVENVDPYHDPELKRLPVDVRVAILDYQEQQRAVDALLQLPFSSH